MKRNAIKVLALILGAQVGSVFGVDIRTELTSSLDARAVKTSCVGDVITGIAYSGSNWGEGDGVTMVSYAGPSGDASGTILAPRHGHGTVTWSKPLKPGTYTLTHSAGGLTATFEVGAEVRTELTSRLDTRAVKTSFVGDSIPDITYSGSGWCGGDGSTTITYKGPTGDAGGTILQMRSGDGKTTWEKPRVPGTYELTHLAGDQTATFEVGGDLRVELTSTLDTRAVKTLDELGVIGGITYSGEGWKTPGCGSSADIAWSCGSSGVVWDGLAGDGTIGWFPPPISGMCTLTHKSGSAVETAQFLFNEWDIPLSVFNIADAEVILSGIPAGGYVYDGTEKTPGVFVVYQGGSVDVGNCAIAYSNNKNVGDNTAIVTLTGKGSFQGATMTTFSIAKGTLDPDDDPDPLDPSVDPDNPGQRGDPNVRFSVFDYVGMYDGKAHTIDTNGLIVAYKAATGGDVAVEYACGGQELSALTWMSEAPTLKDAAVTSFWYKVTSENYNDIIHPCKIAITNCPITLVSGTKLDFDYDGKPHAYTNLSVTAGGFVAGEGIATSNWATVTEVAEGQVPNAFDYAPLAGTKLENYDLTVVTGLIAVVASPEPQKALLKAEIAWKLLKASGTYMAQLKVTCTSGLATGITNLRFMFADRVSGGTIFASLWDTPSRAAKSTTMSYGGDTYRYVALDASKITEENVAVTYGVSNLAATSIPAAERTIELYVRKRVNPTTGKEETAGVDNFVGYLSWTSGGETSYLPVVAGAQAVSLAKAVLMAPAPMKLAAVNTALAVGSVIAEGSSPYCKLTEFAVGDNEITGVVEVGAVSSDGAEYPGKLGPNATVTLLGTNDLGLDFKAICSVTTDSVGRFRLVKPKDCQFFKLKLTVEKVVE